MRLAARRAAATTDPQARRVANVSALAAAYDDLLQRCHAAERSGDWQEGLILGALVDVADQVKRIGDNPASGHYRAEKAGVLLTAAIRLHRTTMLAYGGWPEDDPNEHAVLTAARLLEDVADQVQETIGSSPGVPRDGRRSSRHARADRSRSPRAPPRASRRLAGTARCRNGL